ncbi:CHAD domain-containing protein [Salegentibacter sp. F188]|uniref:CHAD domain-containing protein n=1 Tax=Autumnicola patrickiae TaxID=3075591 RepID=A0ABU3DY69_9FLAO|nr:CHAD domain-containing protein [Salegentibacter sp. F188]MDT0688394.1 CHAD domain-containing protein [Salegentibacter sp. F188]
MSYKLEKQEDLQENINRIASEEIDACLTSLKKAEIHEAVHDIRKRLKKLRALARLVRDEMGEKKYKKINIYFRDLGRELSPVRDLTAHMETVDMLKERYGDHVYVKFFDSIKQELEKERDTVAEELQEKDFFSQYLVEKLEKAKEKLEEWPVKSLDIAVILPSLERVYSRGANALEDAYANPNSETFHEWRKRAKYLWHQSELLQDVWPEMFKTLESEIHILADYLGDDHNLMVLDEKLLNTDFNFKDEKQKEMIHALIKEYSDHLRTNAELHGALIYAEKPKAFKKRIKKYVRVNWN